MLQPILRNQVGKNYYTSTLLVSFFCQYRNIFSAIVGVSTGIKRIRNY